MHLANLSLVIHIVLYGQQQANNASMTAAWFSLPGPWHLNVAQRYWQFWQVGEFIYFIPQFD